MTFQDLRRLNKGIELLSNTAPVHQVRLETWQDLVTGEALWQAQEEPQIERMIMQQSGLASKGISELFRALGPSSSPFRPLLSGSLPCNIQEPELRSGHWPLYGKWRLSQSPFCSFEVGAAKEEPRRGPKNGQAALTLWHALSLASASSSPCKWVGNSVFNVRVVQFRRDDGRERRSSSASSPCARWAPLAPPGNEPLLDMSYSQSYGQ